MLLSLLCCHKSYIVSFEIILDEVLPKSLFGNLCNFFAAVVDLFAQLSDKEVNECRKKVAKIAEKALWKHFIKNYLEAYNVALTAAKERQ